ncbi:DNA-binding response regulator [Paenibacillus pectinilyticus]|uniref:DNA-binding response regulator n=1 Tax=Paenibacillus pectinilyticus TaxID=512399 RepID=A0A1C0ZR26_9BACL|nr:response regulator [Paenibacillus pectinilyticus]OCT10510.1 DNA-binding response regulator [Paenibacillus pectinilyticus]
MRILIVDDEVIIRTGLCTVIDWKELGLELLPAASSAEEALERIPHEKPHIVLTDIRMSGMDGIELAREIKLILPDTEIVILTGYDDFSYAQQALRGGVTDYLLKTSRPEEIIKAALKAKQNIMDKWESVKQDNLQQAALRSQLLDRALSRGLQDDEEARTQLHQWFRKNGVDPIAEDASLPTARQVLFVSCSGWGEMPFADLLLGAAENILYELLPCVTLMKKDHFVLVVRYEAGVTDAAGLKNALKRVSETLKCAVFATLGTVAHDDEGLRASYRAAKDVFAYHGLLSPSGLYTLEDIQERSGSRTVCTEKEESELAAILMNDNATDLRHWVNQKVRAQLEDAAATPLSVQGYLQSMVIAGYRWLERARSAEQEMSALSALPKLEGEGRPEEEVFKLLSAIMSLFHQGLDQSKYAYIHKSIAYIRDNLHQPISLQQVAGFVHINPNHFSEVFKRETGCTYLEFVTRERMKLATDIVQSTQMKVSDIARRVGYEDIKYFTQQFKKHTGRTPSEFRQGSKD